MWISSTTNIEFGLVKYNATNSSVERKTLDNILAIYDSTTRKSTSEVNI